MSIFNNTKKRRAYIKGYLAEYYAGFMLLCKGYRIKAIRHRNVLGEIDIIAMKNDLAIFIEVKARKTTQIGIDAVTATAHSCSQRYMACQTA